MSTIRAKLKCIVVEKTASTETVRLEPVTATSEENKTWSKYTPSGEISLSITNEAAFGAFVPGAEYFATFEPA